MNREAFVAMKIKRILCIAFSALMLLFCASCSRGEPPAVSKVSLTESRVRFGAFQEDIEQILHDRSVDYTLTVTSSDDMPGAQPNTYSITLQYVLKIPDEEALTVTLFNADETERFIVVLKADRATVNECEFKMGDYPFLLDVFNLLSDTGTSKYECNRLMRSVRSGAAERYEQQGDAFYTFKSKELFKGDEERYLSYDIQYSDSKQPAFFTETLTFAGFTSARQADNTNG